MKARLLTIAKLALYPLFYLFCLVVFSYLTFPYERLKERLIAEFAKKQAHKGKNAYRLEIDELSPYWFTGVEVTGVRIIMPPTPEEKAKAKLPSSGSRSPSPTLNSDTDTATGTDTATATDAALKDSVVTIDEAHVRAQFWPLLIGRVRLDFEALAFGGEVSGEIPFGGGDVHVEMEGLDLSKIEPLTELVSVPVLGIADASLDLSLVEGKFAKSNGAFKLTMRDVAIGDGKAKFKNMVTLPVAKVGALEITAEAKDGVLKFPEFGASGNDIELFGDGKITFRDPWEQSVLDMNLRFKFSDGYRAKDDKTKSLFGNPDPSYKLPALIEVQGGTKNKFKQAKREDGFYGFHAGGRLNKPKFNPDKSGTGADARKKQKKPAAKKSAVDDDGDETPPIATTHKVPRPTRPTISPRPKQPALPVPDSQPLPVQPDSQPPPEVVPPDPQPPPEPPPPQDEGQVPPPDPNAPPDNPDQPNEPVPAPER